MLTDDIAQRPTVTTLDTKPLIDEIKSVVKKKAPGISGVTTDMIKNWPEEGFKLLTAYIQ